MDRLALAVVFAASIVACERSSTTTPEPAPAEAPSQPAPEPEPEVADEPEPAPEPEPEPEPESDPEVSELDRPTFSQDGFEARGLKCKLNNPTRSGDRYIIAGLVDADAALDACAPKGAAVEVSWSYVSNQAADITVDASTSSVAKCVGAAMSQVRAGVEASCSAILLIGDSAGATAAYDKR